MLRDIRVLLADVVSKQTIQNLHSFGFRSTLAVGTDSLTMTEYTSVCNLFSRKGIFEVVPRYPLAPRGSLEEALRGKIEEPTPMSYWFTVKFSATASLEVKQNLIQDLENSPYIRKVVLDGGS